MEDLGIPRSSIVSVSLPAGALNREGGSADDTPGGRHAEDQEDEEQDQEQAGQELRNRDRRAGYRREAEKRCDKSDDEEHKRHVEHDFNPPLLRLAKAVPLTYMDEL
jgi:hypothetical protein